MLLVDVQYRVAMECHFLLVYGPVSGVGGSIWRFRIRFGFTRLVSSHAFSLLLNLTLLECFLVLPLLLLHSNNHVLLVFLEELSLRFRGVVKAAFWRGGFLILSKRCLIVNAFIDLLELWLHLDAAITQLCLHHDQVDFWRHGESCVCRLACCKE